MRRWCGSKMLGGMMSTEKHFDAWSLLVITLTLLLFVTALFAKGFTHDLLLEAGVFLVSAKLILMSYKTSLANATIQQKLDAIQRRVDQPSDTGADRAA